MTEYVTVVICDQLFGLPIACVQDVFIPQQLTRVPLAPPEIAGVLNLRGRIVTAIDMASRLGLQRQAGHFAQLAVSIEFAGEWYGLLIDAVGEVLKLAEDTREPIPVNLDRRLASVSAGVHRLEGELMVVLDVPHVLRIGSNAMAA
jgi:purine-binding chemotaxis protein CheW